MIREVPSRVLAEMASEAIAAGVEVRVAVRGRSMEPTLVNGDVVTLAPVEKKRLRPGCIVAWRTDAGMVVHRYLGRLSDGRLRTAGDNVGHRDRPPRREDLVGIVVEVERGGRRFVPRAGGLEALRWEVRRVPAWLRRRLRMA